MEVLINAPGPGQIIVDRLRPGSYFGEMALLGNGVRAATVKAASAGPASVIALDKAAFNDLVSDSRPLREELLQLLVGHEVDERTRELAMAVRKVVAGGGCEPVEVLGTPWTMRRGRSHGGEA